MSQRDSFLSSLDLPVPKKEFIQLEILNKRLNEKLEDPSFINDVSKFVDKESEKLVKQISKTSESVFILSALLDRYSPEIIPT